MSNTASGQVNNSSSPGRKTPTIDGDILVYLQEQQYPDPLLAGTNELDYSLFSDPNNMSQGGLPFLFDSAALDSTQIDRSIWPGYGADPTDNMWHPMADDSQTVGTYDGYGYYDSAPAMSPSQVFLYLPWNPQQDQPLPSPVSEAPAYTLSGSPLMGTDAPAYISPNPVAPTPAQLTSAQQPTPPETTPGSTTTTAGTPLQTIKGKGKQKAHAKKISMPSLKRSAAESILRPPSAAGARPQVLKRYRSDSNSLTLSSLNTTTTLTNNNNNYYYSSSTTPTPKTPTTPTTLMMTMTTENKALGGVLPANVDPRVASQEICRAARERSMAESHEMSERRRMLLDHEHGALEREMQRLQVNLGRMRELDKKREEKGNEEEEDDYGDDGAELDGEGEVDEEEIT
ncbi:uncharacterized protein B0T15DRAFT_13548 [Chaetomium strumarium]|uniref:Uncharacterized protein n=1 Tax=Chaetomium strumarium TaxID=1170767 RepID=A0AAJ0M5L1_9PEZI|nr:hypothetical protein B0T15DRAFT_13548 [Chaetomium strumarium]